MSFLKTILVDDEFVINGIPLVDDSLSEFCYILGKPSLPVKLAGRIEDDDIGEYISPTSGKISPLIKKANFNWSTALQSQNSVQATLDFEVSSICVTRPFLPVLNIIQETQSPPTSYLLNILSTLLPICIYLPRAGGVDVLSTICHKFNSIKGGVLTNFSQTIFVLEDTTFKYSLGVSTDSRIVQCKNGEVKILT
jgi:hypothetical protein